MFYILKDNHTHYKYYLQYPGHL